MYCYHNGKMNVDLYNTEYSASEEKDTGSVDILSGMKRTTVWQGAEEVKAHFRIWVNA